MNGSTKRGWWLLVIAVAVLASSCTGDSGNAFGVPDCAEFIDGQAVPAYSLSESDNGGPGASCFDAEANSLVLSAVWDCDDGSSFVGRDDGYYLSADGIWHESPDGAQDRQDAFWGTCKGQ